MAQVKPVWVRVSLPYATFGIRVHNKKVIDAAPIGRWMIGKDTDTVRQWVKKKGGTCLLLTP